MSIILITLVVSFILAFSLGIGLGFFRERFKVVRDPKIERIREALPGANCGACGFPGCDAYAEAVGKEETTPDRCSVGGTATAKALAEILGISIEAEDKVVVLMCQGTKDRAPEKGEYVGIKTCAAVKLSAGGTKLCAWGCYGFGDCERACPFDAIHVGGDGIPHVDYEKCTGCGKCVTACPQKVLSLVPRNRTGSVPLCSNRNPIKAMVRKTCSVGCFKCELCVRSCPEKAIQMVNGLPVVDYTKCKSHAVCVAKCPTHVFKLLEKGVFTEGEEMPSVEEAVLSGTVSKDTK
jgi:Na+-translocating ferredoxin:NAD+ oxidoreductase RNF subunit RnfB